MKNILFSYLHKLTVLLEKNNTEFEGLPFDFKICFILDNMQKKLKIIFFGLYR